MITRRLAGAALVVAALAGTSATPVSAAQPPAGLPQQGIQSVTAITQVHTYGQKVDAVAVEYSAPVNPRELDLDTFTVSDSIYNFRYNPIDDLGVRADRTITRVYTNDMIALNPYGRSTPGRYVIVELAPTDAGGNTVIAEGRYVKVNPDQPTQVMQNEDVYARPGGGIGRGRVLSEASSTAHALTGQSVDLLVDDFAYETFVQGGTVLPYAYHLPDDYHPQRDYPLVVILPGHGMGWNGTNTGVQVAADIPATAWLQPEWTGAGEDVIVLAPQNQRVGAAAEAALMVALVENFMGRFSVDSERVYASTVSYGSTLAWQTLATEPGQFTAVLLTGGFRVSADQAARIAAHPTPIWITHGTNDHLLPVAFARDSAVLLRDAYVAAGVAPSVAADIIRYTEYGNNAFTEPDYHAAYGPTYEDASILRWLLAQEG
ncbi:hypothetical protein E1262_00920 [Jiangella aurantiaca]|uniref:Esterase Ig-like N-terminal domain-containing protein n=1 Tax=Jiangella aurantiaca TaxID=2530373 RepID=A0A4R5AN71_9ACTN|nr:PHB depolymerase family esterase [Jiangella aurantiaca]TDD73079.1 hypothetical protein E1262_00920 [Jiangella aurantiaca]